MSTMMITIYCHTPKNNSDVIVTYSGHAEALNQPPILPQTTMKPETTTKEPSTEFIITTQYNTHYKTRKTTPFYDEDTESVVFIPNEKPIHRNRESEYHDDNLRIKDILTQEKTVNDIFNDKKIILQTESPKQDIFFISGKNSENENVFEQKNKKKSDKTQTNYRRNNTPDVNQIILDCKKLDCNNTLKSVCGGKVERKRWRYRLFLNECYFNKVNCNFKYQENRFQVVPFEKCNNVAGHYYSERPFVYTPQFMMPKAKPEKVPEYRRTSSSRRSLNIDMDGKFCSHPCPSSCPEQYEPECAMSNRGLRRVFVNHCKLDYNSCSYGAVWHKRPLAECVGGKKADMTRNSAFIGWMQRVGIVDNKGRLNLE